MIVPRALSTRVTYKHLGLACELAAAAVYRHPQHKNRLSIPAASLLDRCLRVSENLLRGTASDIEGSPESARIAEVLTAAAEGQRKEEKRTSYATATLHFVERTLGLIRLPCRKDIRKARKSTAFTEERRRARLCGTYSTPDFIVQSMFEELFSALNKDKESELEILDLSVEAGHFALAARRWASRGRKIRFYGVDRDPVAVELASRIVRFASRGQRLSNFLFGASCQDSFFDGLPRAWPQQYTAVVGNPPWVARKPVVCQPLREKFWPLLRGHYDIYLAFMLRAHELLKPGGYLSYVVPSGFLFNCTAAPIRRLLLEEYEILSLTSYPQRSFIEVPCIIPISFLARKKRLRNAVIASTRIISEDTGLGGQDHPQGAITVRVAHIWKRLPNCVLNPLVREGSEFLVSELRGIPLGSLGKVSSGARLARSRYASASVFQAVHARDLRPYHACLRRGRFYGRRDKVFDRAPDREAIEAKKIVFQELRYITAGQRLVAAVAGAGTYPVSTAGLFLPKDSRHILFFAALLNSALANAWYKLRDLNRAIKITYLRQFPVPERIEKWQVIGKLAQQCTRLRCFFHERVVSCTQREEGRRLAKQFPDQWGRLVSCQREIDLQILELYQVPSQHHAAVFQLARARLFCRPHAAQFSAF